jgi:hypothetical protein
MLRELACALLGILLTTGLAAGAVDPTDKCAAAKIAAAGKYSMCLLKAESTAIKRGLEAPDFSKCDFKLSKSWTRIEERGGQACPTLGDEMPLSLQVTSDAARLVDGLWGAPTVGIGTIETEYDILSIEQEEERTIWVEAVDGWGDPVSFTAVAEDGSCVTVSSAPNGITLTGVGEYCDETITLESPDTGVTKTLEVKVYDPMVMDIGQNGEHLLIKYADQFDCRWNDANTGGTNSGEFYHPVADAEDGWFPLGSTITGYYAGCYPNDPSTFGPGPVELPSASRKEVVILVKELSPDPDVQDPLPILMAPVSYTELWSNYMGNGNQTGDFRGAVWNAICPDGYVALGAVTTSYWLPSGLPAPNDMRCVREDYTTPAEIAEWIYDDKNTRATRNLGVFRIGPPSIPALLEGRAPLDVGAVIACPGHEPDKCDPNLARLLLVPLEVAEKRESQLDEVSLDKDGNIVGGDIRYAASIRIPFTLIPNLDCGSNPSQCRFNVEFSPFYRLKREEVYEKIQELDNRASGEKATQTITYTTGFSQTDTEAFSVTVGLEVTANGEASLLGSGGGWSVKVSTQFGWDWSTAKNYSTGTSLQWQMTCPAFTYGVAAQVKTHFIAFPEYDPGPIVSSPLEGGRNSLRWLQYPPVFPLRAGSN